MAISFVGAGTVQTGANSTVNVPAGIAAGDTLLIFTSGTATPTTPTNWTSIFFQGTGRYLTVLLKIATASESSVTLVQSGTSSKAVMLAYRGTSYFDVVGTVATGTSTSPATTSQTTRFANDYVVSFYATQLNATPSTWTAPASTTSRVNSGNSASVTGMLIVDELQVSAGASATRTATLSLSTAWSAISISFKEPQVFYIDPVNGADANNGQTFATALKNISGATSAKGVQAGDTVRIEEAPIYDTGVNATWTSVTSRGITPFSTFTITAATNAAPIVCTFNNHGYSTGDVIQISGANGNTAANGIWKITVTSSSQFSLDDSSGNGTWSSGGAISPIFCRTIKTASALVKPIASFAPLRTASLGTRVAWVGSANVTTTLATTFGKGSVYDQITIASGFTTGKIAYYTLPATLDLSPYQQLSLFIYQNSGTLGGLTISLCSDTTGDTAVDTFTIPSSGASAVWCPFTINKGSALGSSIRSVSISRAANNGTQLFIFNSIVAVKSPTSVDALSNTSLVTKNNGTEGAYAVGGFGGSDGTIVFLDSSPTALSNLTITGGAYYGTTETAGLWRYEPLNPYTLNSAALPASQSTTTTYNVFPANSGILNAPITYSGGWDSTNMSTRTGQTWFSNQNGYGYGLYNFNSTNDITIDRVNYTRCSIGWYSDTIFTRNLVQNCNYTATSSSGFASTGNINTGGQIQSCIVTNTAATAGITISNGSIDINNPVVINNCTFSGNVTNNLLINNSTNGYPYYNITNSSFNTSSVTGINASNFTYGTITSNSVNYFNTTGLSTTNNIIGTINNLTFVPEPNGGTQIIVNTGTASYSVLPQNIYATFNNVTVNAPTTTYSQGTTNVVYLLNGCSNFKFVNGSFGATNVSYTSGNLLADQGGSYLYNCTGVPSTITAGGNNVLPYIVNAAIYSQDEGNTVGNNKIYFSGGLATSQTAVRNTPSGYAWSLAPTSTSTVTSAFPLKLKIASVAANGGSAVTISAYMRRTNTGLTMQLVCPANQPYGPTSDTTASITAVADTWEQVSISFTPTQNAVFDIYVYVYGGTTFTGYVDDLGVTQ
jgi:hypothetical protein